MGTLGWVITFFIFIIIVWFSVQYTKKLYNDFLNKWKNMTFIPNNEYEYKPEDDEKYVTGKLYLFYADWCNASKETMPLWDDYERKYNGDIMGLQFYKINVDNEENTIIIDKFNINEYPTVVLQIDKDDKKYYYDTNFNSDTIDMFLIDVAIKYAK